MNTLNTTNNRYHIAQLKVFATTFNDAAEIADDTYIKPVSISSRSILFYVGMTRTNLYYLQLSNRHYYLILFFIRMVSSFMNKTLRYYHREVSRTPMQSKDLPIHQHIRTKLTKKSLNIKNVDFWELLKHRYVLCTNHNVNTMNTILIFMVFNVPLIGLPPSSSGFFHFRVTELLSYFVISRFLGSEGGSANKGDFLFNYWFSSMTHRCNCEREWLVQNVNLFIPNGFLARIALSVSVGSLTP